MLTVEAVVQFDSMCWCEVECVEVSFDEVKSE